MIYNSTILLVILLIIFGVFSDMRTLRTKRKIVFLKGSKLYVRLNFKCQTFPTTILIAYAAGYKLSFNLPDDAKTGPFHFSRRAIYENVESILDQHGINGRACILRFLREASQYMMPKNDLYKKILTIIFTIPAGKEHTVFPYSRTGDCREATEECPISFFHLISLQQVYDL